MKRSESNDWIDIYNWLGSEVISIQDGRHSKAIIANIDGCNSALFTDIEQKSGVATVKICLI